MYCKDKNKNTSHVGFIFDMCMNNFFFARRIYIIVYAYFFSAEISTMYWNFRIYGEISPEIWTLNFSIFSWNFTCLAEISQISGKFQIFSAEILLKRPEIYKICQISAVSAQFQLKSIIPIQKC